MYSEKNGYVYFPNSLFLIICTVDNSQAVSIIKILNLPEKVVREISQTVNFYRKSNLHLLCVEFNEPIKNFKNKALYFNGVIFNIVRESKPYQNYDSQRLLKMSLMGSLEEISSM